MKSARSEFLWTTGPKWRFCLTEDFTICLGTGWLGYHEFYHGGALWGVLRGDVLTIKKDFAWNGCSPAWRIFGRWVGTPTPRSAMVPSLIHDFLYQFLDLECAPWDKRQADHIFYNLMVEYEFCLRGTYHGTVAALGAAFRRLTPGDPKTSCGFCR